MALARMLALGALLIPLLATGWWISRPVPATLLAQDKQRSGLTIEDRNGLQLHSSRAADGSRARWIAYADIDPDLINAFVSVEDRRFWEHGGVDVRALVRALRDNLLARDVVSGASTISMQLARLLHGTKRNWSGKYLQAIWALRLERHLRKQEILEQYLNRVHLGQATVGVEAASQLYFATSASAVSVAQAATLAGLAHAPSRDNPHVAPARARARQALALRRMRRAGTATDEDLARGRIEPLIAARRSTPFLAAHFTARALAWADSQAGTSRVVRTSLDLPLQAAVEADVRHTTQTLRDLGVTHAAAVVLHNATGEVLAWVGSPDFWSADDGQTDMVVSARQPGSSLKPFVYALALDRGYTAASVLPDIPTTYPTATGPYSPRNYDRRFRGPVRVREALASSYNVPAVELTERLGASSVLHTLRLAGFESLRRDAQHYGLGLALGNGDVTLLELANAYRALANGGEWRPWTWQDEQPTGDRSRDGRRVMSRMSSAIVLDILRDPHARIPGFGTSTPFDFAFPVAVKTGTSRHFSDNWAVGTAGNFTVAVWAGNFSGRPMAGVSGITGAGPLLHRVVVATAKRFPPGVLPTPAEAGAVPTNVCKLSGLLATPECAQLSEWFAPGTQPSRVDDWEHGGRVMLPAEYAAWTGLSSRRSAATEGSAGDVPLPRVARNDEPESSRVSDATEGSAAAFRIVSPLDGDRYTVPPGIEAQYATISLRAVGHGDSTVRWLVDGRPHGASRWALRRGEHVIRAETRTGQSAEVRIVVE